MAVDTNNVQSSDIVSTAKQVAQDGRNVTYQVLLASGDNNNNTGNIKISNGPKEQIQTLQP